MKLAKHSDIVSKELKITITPAFVRLDFLGLCYAEIRHDGCGLPDALRTIADIIEKNLDSMDKRAKEWNG